MPIMYDDDGVVEINGVLLSRSEYDRLNADAEKWRTRIGTAPPNADGTLSVSGGVPSTRTRDDAELGALVRRMPVRSALLHSTNETAEPSVWAFTRAVGNVPCDLKTITYEPVDTLRAAFDDFDKQPDLLDKYSQESGISREDLEDDPMQLVNWLRKQGKHYGA